MNQCTHCHGEGQTAVCLTVPESRTVRDRLTIDIRVAERHTVIRTAVRKDFRKSL